VAKRKHYTDEFRASAVIMLESQGYPHVKGSLTAVSKHLNVPLRTLSRWFNKEQNPPPDQLVKEKRGELIERLPGLLEQLVNEMELAIKDAPLSQLATTFGIVVDKQQLLKGSPTERIAHEHELSDAERSARIASLLDAARNRRDGLVVNEGPDAIH
jgi:transposase-like protein